MNRKSLRRWTFLGAWAALALHLSCNPELEGGGGNCPPGESCPGKDPGPGPSPTTPDKFEKVGPGTGSPFNPGADGSTGIKLDDKGNVVLDPGNLMGSMTPIIWVANSGEGTISKVDTRSLKEVARYYTFPGGGADPSRTSVSLGGDVVVANRARPDGHKASAVKIAGDKSGCVDRNKNGKIDTFEGAGQVPAAFQWADGQKESPDECVLWLTNLSNGSSSTLPRAVGFDAEISGEGMAGSMVYVGLHATKELVRLDAGTGAVLKRIPLGIAPYGLVLDKGGNVWLLDTAGALARVEVRNGDRLTVWNGAKGPPCRYGITADSNGLIYTAGGSCISRFRPQTETWESLAVPGASSLRGVAVDQNFGVWSAETSKGMVHVDGKGAAMVYKSLVQVTGSNVGAAIDADGKPWVISQGQSMAHKIDPATYKAQPVNVGQGPYTYSDMTGFQLRNAGAPFGLYRRTFLGCGADTRWLTLNWQALVPQGAQVVVRYRIAASVADLAAAPWTQLASLPPDMPALPLAITGKGAVLQVEFAMRAADAKITPVLSSVDAGYRCDIVIG